LVEHQPSKLDTWVRFPSPAFFVAQNKRSARCKTILLDKCQQNGSE
jgi:hypothetical protein